MSKCESCQRYTACSNGSGGGLMWPCGSYSPRQAVPEKITTYPQMNETIKDLLRQSQEPINLYTLARIEELEQQNAAMLEAWRETCEACGFNDACENDDGCENVVCGAHTWRKLWKKAGTPAKTRFSRIKASKTPEEMTVELNANSRRFCPKAYWRKGDDCTAPCGECITSWLREEA